MKIFFPKQRRYFSELEKLFIIADLTSLLSKFNIWASSGALSDCIFPCGPHFLCLFTSNNFFVVEKWNICSSSYSATGISRELPDRTNNDSVCEWGFWGHSTPLHLKGRGKLYEHRTMGWGKVKMLQSSQFLPRLLFFKK